ncbi:cytochrome C [Notoacmeibacter marinus]|uniref:Cytochrome C n=1 Tax=Notoacmeibacter marinus TaxID=1876515 RepID=A0A231V109_9HYPH|nr:cytochrome c [Notoacmeibacter marinus]OXT01878.1 cytochrome C [Notoacmeibacter marinus]
MDRKSAFIAIALLAAVATAWFVLFRGDAPDAVAERNEAGLQLSIPDFSTEQLAGKALFDANCATCHGANAAGSEQGPPLVHRIYEPSHHGDQAFILAALNGVRAHHWQFGNMPPVKGVSESDVGKITNYIRTIQRANGID